jgi:integrase
MAATAHLRSASGLRVATLKTLIGLLAATGLRPGEALSLDVGDVDLVSGILTIRESKFGKSRFVPLDESARVALAAYSTFRDTVLPRRETPAFLVTERGSRLGRHAVRRTFANLCKTVGLRPMGQPHRAGLGPRLQDMRHYVPFRTMSGSASLFADMIGILDQVEKSSSRLPDIVFPGLQTVEKSQ